MEGKMLRKTALTAAFILSMIHGAFAGSAADKAAEAEAALQAGDHVKAISLMRSALIEVWKAAPLSIEKAIFVTEPAAGYGVYRERPTNVYGEGETLLIYMEPIGFSWAEENGLFQSRMVVDFDLLAPDGNVLAGKKDFGTFEFVSNAHNTEYMANMTLNLTGAPKASYILQVTLRDKFNNDLSTSVRMPFEIK
jgi:hypothetical protein